MNDCSSFVKRIKVVSRFVSLLLPVEIMSDFLSYVQLFLRYKFPCAKKYVLNMGRYVPVEIISANLCFVFFVFLFQVV